MTSVYTYSVDLENVRILKEKSLLVEMGSQKLPLLKRAGAFKSHADDPFFVKKAEDAKALVKKYGLPKR